MSAMGRLLGAALAAAAIPPGPPQEPTEPEALPVLECWFVVPQEERYREMANLQRRMRAHAQAEFEEMDFRVFEQMYSDDQAFVSFFHYPDLKAERDGRTTRGGDAEWVEMFTAMVEASVAEGSTRSILLPVAGPAGRPRARVCRIFSRSRIHPFRRAAAQRRARELVDHLNATFEGVAAYAYVDDLGTPYDLYLFLDYEALWERNPLGAATSWEATRRELLEDERYEELLGRLGDVLEEPISEIVGLTLQ